jgi:hypothetical protein
MQLPPAKLFAPPDGNRSRLLLSSEKRSFLGISLRAAGQRQRKYRYICRYLVRFWYGRWPQAGQWRGAVSDSNHPLTPLLENVIGGGVCGELKQWLGNQNATLMLHRSPELGFAVIGNSWVQLRLEHIVRAPSHSTLWGWLAQKCLESSLTLVNHILIPLQCVFEKLACLRDDDDLSRVSKRHDRWSLTDCASFLIMEENRFTAALTQQGPQAVAETVFCFQLERMVRRAA